MRPLIRRRLITKSTGSETQGISGKYIYYNKGLNETNSLYLRRSTDYGNTWETVSGQNIYSTYDNIIGISPNGKYVYIIDDIGRIRKSTNYGDTWEDYRINGIENSEKIECSDNGIIFVLASIDPQSSAYDRTLYKSTDYGVTFNKISSLSRTKLDDFAVSSDLRVIVAFNTNNLYYSTDYGNTWSQNNYSDDIGICDKIAISGDGSKIIMLSTFDEEMYISNNYGKRWITKRHMDVGITDTDVNGGIALSENSQYQYFTGRNTTGQYSANVEVYKSNDFGETFHKIYSTDERSEAGKIKCSADGKVVIESYHGGLVVSNDYGATFNKINNKEIYNYFDLNY